MQQQTQAEVTPIRDSEALGTFLEKQVKLSVVKNESSGLINLYIAAKASSEDFAQSLKAVAESAGVLPAVLRKLVKARAGDKFDKARKEVEQLAMVFDEVGE